MRQFFISASDASTNWLVFLAILLVICFFIGVVVVWFALFRKKGKKHRKRRRHRHRHKNPTLAETGGLPPIREVKKADGQKPPTP